MKQERNSGSVTGNVTTKFIIKGAFFGEKCFPGLNDLLHEAEKHPNAYNQMKRQYESIAVNAIRRHLRGWKATGLVIFLIMSLESQIKAIREIMTTLWLLEGRLSTMH